MRSVYFMATIKKQTKTTSNTLESDAVRASIDYGIDISMLSDNVKRNPSERIRRHQIALNTAEKLSFSLNQ